MSGEAFLRPPAITCRACGKRHGARYLCDPLAEVVKVMMDAAEASDIPITEFVHAKPLDNRATGVLTNPDTILTGQVTIKGAVVPFQVEGKPTKLIYPALVFTGFDADGKPLPQWVFTGSPHELRALRDVCDQMTEMAIRRAEEATT